MKHILELVASTVLVGAAVPTLVAQDWIGVQPRIASEVHSVTPADAVDLLASVCRNGLRIEDGVGLTCTTRDLGDAFADIVDAAFHAKAVIYGHFLAPNSEDAAVSGWSAETHPYLWSGTLLLTKRDGKWTPLWYKSAVVTSFCRKVDMPNGREILVGEVEDRGMGHILHYIFSVDLAAPVDVRKSLLATADSYTSSCMIHKQEIGRVDWDANARRLSIELRTPPWSRTSNDTCAGDPAPSKRPPAMSILEFALTNHGFRAVAAQR